MNKDNDFQKEGIRFYPDGTTEVIGHPKELASVVREIKKPNFSQKRGFELWGDLSVGQLTEKLKTYDNEDEPSPD